MIVEVQHNGKVYKVTIGKITYGQRNEIIEACTDSVIEDGKMRSKVNYAKLEKMLVSMSVKKVEPEVDNILKFIENLEMDEAQKIINAIMKVNPLVI